MYRISIFFPFLLLISCLEKNPNEGTHAQRVIEDRHVAANSDIMAVVDTVYVPIYSDIYSKTKDSRFLLTATLSIRNTSLVDTIYMNSIDYYNTQGDLVRSYIENTSYLRPMETIDYVIEQDDDTGGSGANFLIIWSARHKHVKPVFQAIHISTNGQQGVSFTTEGKSISRGY
ncbi:DUF3124 domain-containing protein [Reichenbachiella sp. MALMAid0571]|uniref:DUF3124 domain-containing protein n=1 Tax=Reichenbachiella sp. MALMAid0571 TaxID=3143939 RepID=UPI0032DE475F